MFMGIILINTVIGIIQEIRAKKTIDKLAILTESKTVVLREGKKWSISTEKLVLDDLIFLKTGDQVPADVKVLEGTVEVTSLYSPVSRTICPKARETNFFQEAL